MEFHTPTRRKPVINVTSLIDVMFLLLIFFIVSTTFVERPAIRIDLPSAAHASPTHAGNLVVSVAEDGSLFFNGEPVDRPGLAAELKEIAARDAQSLLVIEADKAVPHGIVIQVMDSARGAGLTRIVLPLRRDAGAEGDS